MNLAQHLRRRKLPSALVRFSRYGVSIALTIQCLCPHVQGSQGEYATGLDTAALYQKRAQERFKRLGMQYPEGDTVNEQEIQKSLVTVYPQESRLRLNAGEVLTSTLPHRVVVSGESAPVWLTIQNGPSWTQGLTLLGKARGTTGSRVAIDIERLKLHTGRTIGIRAQVLDHAGALALEAQVFSAKLLATAGALGAGFLSGLATGFQSNQSNGLGVLSNPPTPRNAILQGLAQSSADQSKRLIDDATKEKPVFVVEPGTPLLIFVEEELKWTP